MNYFKELKNMGDRERILISSAMAIRSNMIRKSCYDNFNKPEPGDLVFATTSRANPFKIAWMVEDYGDDQSFNEVCEMSQDVRTIKYNLSDTPGQIEDWLARTG